MPRSNKKKSEDLSALGASLEAAMRETDTHYDRALSSIFTENVEDQATIDLYAKRRQLNDILCDAMRQRDNKAALTIINLSDFQLDPSRIIMDQDPITYALNNNSDDVVMALLNQPLDIINTLLENAPIIKTVLEKKRDALVGKILDLPKEKYAPMLHKINDCWNDDILEQAPYSRLLDEAEWAEVKPTLSVHDLLTLIDQSSIARLGFFIANNENCNNFKEFWRSKSDRSRDEGYLAPYKKAEVIIVSPLGHAITKNKWPQACIILDQKNINHRKVIEFHFQIIEYVQGTAQALKTIAKKNILSSQAWDFIAAYEDKTGATKPVVTRPKVKREKKARKFKLK